MADAELSVGPRQVPRHRFATEVERIADLVRTKSCGGQPQHARLHVRQPPISHALTMGEDAYLSVTSG